MGQAVEGYTQIDCNCAYYMVITNDSFPLLDDSYTCGLAAIFVPEARQKFGKKSMSKYENIWEIKTFKILWLKYFGYSRKYANWPIVCFHERIKFHEYGGYFSVFKNCGKYTLSNRQVNNKRNRYRQWCGTDSQKITQNFIKTRGFLGV